MRSKVKSLAVMRNLSLLYPMYGWSGRVCELMAGPRDCAAITRYMNQAPVGSFVAVTAKFTLLKSKVSMMDA